MHFASPYPWWLAAVIGAAIVALAVAAYWRPLVPLSRGRRVGLASLRALTLAMLAVILARPAVLVPPRDARDRTVALLVDVSRSMRVPDAADGTSRAAAAEALLARLVPDLETRFKTDVYTFGETLGPAPAAPLAPDARQSHLTDAIRAVVDRYRGRPVASLIVVTDGAETSRARELEPGSAVPPVVAVGVGGEREVPDREIVGVSAGDPRLDQTTVDVRVTAVSRGLGRDPFTIRVMADGRLVEAREITPAASDASVDETFTVTPSLAAPTVVSAEIAVDTREAITENNQRGVMISPAGRKRRVLALAGAPGFDHSFLLRALGRDPGLDVDIVVRKGKDDEGHATFLVQAGGGRAANLTAGFPATQEALFAYDAVIVANLESDFFTRAQHQSLAEFVSERGGGLLVLGALSFTQRGLMGTPLEEVLPLELADRRGGVRQSFDAGRAARPLLPVVTPDGLAHPVMRIGASAAETERLWGTMPRLAAAAPLGGPRPGAVVLAVTSQPDGGVVPLIAAQRYGRGRSLVFGGEGAWRWKMALPSTDHSYEYFWRQAVRWLGGSAPDPVTLAVPEGVEPGDAVAITADVRDSVYVPSPDASVESTLTAPDGSIAALAFQRDGSVAGRLGASFRPDRPGLYRVQLRAASGSTPLGTAERWIHVGGSDRELSDPRMNEGVLRRLADVTRGRYLRASDAAGVVAWLDSDAAAPGLSIRRELWHEPWVFALLVALMATEWVLRRRWGLR